MELKDRFLKYVSFDTQSDESSETFPSTAKQRVLLDYLAEEMKTLGLTEVTVDKYGYAMGTIPATPGCEKRWQGLRPCQSRKCGRSNINIIRSENHPILRSRLP